MQRNRPMQIACGLALLLASSPAFAQSAADPDSVRELNAIVRDLQSQVRDLKAAVSELREESGRYRAETEHLRGEISALQGAPSPPASATTAAGSSSSTSSTQQRLANLEEQQELLNAKVTEQHSTKVESASKYRVRLSGIVLLNVFNNQGAVDNIDIPALAAGYGGGSAGATMRQTLLGLEVFGPTVAGARTHADLEMDFAGGFPNVPNGVTSGLVRMRTAGLHLDWDRTSIVAGQEPLFVAPLVPTSFATLAVPALSYSGALWSWAPQLYVQHRIDTGETSHFTVSAGVLDPLAGNVPANSFYRQPDPGEASRKPGVGGRVAWSHRMFGKEITVGGAGYYSKQNWGFNRTVNGWAGITDWDIPFTKWLKLSGEFYRGSAIGGLGADYGHSVLYTGSISDPATVIRPLDDMGGWTQLKVLATPKLEFNGAAGQDNPFAGELRPYFGALDYAALSRNRTGFVNMVYRPRSDLLFSLELRHIRTFELGGYSQAANHVNLAMGYLF